MPLDPGPGVEFINLEDFRKTITTLERIRTMLSVLLLLLSVLLLLLRELVSGDRSEVRKGTFLNGIGVSRF